MTYNCPNPVLLNMPGVPPKPLVGAANIRNINQKNNYIRVPQIRE